MNRWKCEEKATKSEKEEEYISGIIWTLEQAVPEAYSSEHFSYMTY